MNKKSLNLDLNPYQINGVIHVGAGTGAYADYYHKLGIHKVLWLEAQGHLYGTLYSNTCQYGMNQKILTGAQILGHDALPSVKKLVTLWRENASFLDMESYDLLHIGCSKNHLQILEGCDFLLSNFRAIVFSAGDLTEEVHSFLSNKGYDKVLWVTAEMNDFETLYMKR